jgi:hypothetical protein
MRDEHLLGYQPRVGEGLSAINSKIVVFRYFYNRKKKLNSDINCVSVCEQATVLLDIVTVTNRKQGELTCLYERGRLDGRWRCGVLRGAKGAKSGEGAGKGSAKAADGTIHRIGAQAERSESRVRPRFFLLS